MNASSSSSSSSSRVLPPRSQAPFDTVEGFVARFVNPLLSGGQVEVHAPMSAEQRDRMLGDAGALLDPEFAALRTRAGQRLVADPELPDPGGDELSLWLGLHGILALDHPDTERVWTRVKTWRKVENETRRLLAFARPTSMDEALARHLAVGAFLELRRVDTIVSNAAGEERHRGQTPVIRRFSRLVAEPSDVRTESVRWIEQTHSPAVARLLPDVMWVSPLTALLAPGWAPPGWSPLMAAAFVRSRAHARAVCHCWAREREWVRVGGIVAGSMLRALGLAAEVFSDAPAPGIPGVAPVMQRGRSSSEGEGEGSGEGDGSGDDKDSGDSGEGADAKVGGLPALPAPRVEFDHLDIGAVVGALIHLHLLKVLEFDARISIGLSSRDWAVQTFLALPLLLPHLEEVLGSPLDELALADESFPRRWEEYREHLAGMVPRTVVDNLVATLVQRVVERQPQ